MTLNSEELSELLKLVKSEWEHATLESDIEFYCNLYLKLRNEHASRSSEVS
jgi:hypothetical protein